MAAAQYLWLYLAGALLVPGRPFYLVLYFLGGLVLLAKLSLDHSLKRVVVERSLSEERLFPGERVQVTLRFTNPTGIPVPWLQFTEIRPGRFAAGAFSGVLTLGGGESATVSYELEPNRRGRYEVGPVDLAAGDPFGLHRFKGVVENRATFTVYPRISPLPAMGLPARLPLGDLAIRRRLFEDPAWLAGTRPYDPGDSPRRIHWSATARVGELVVKQFRHAMLLPCLVAVNLNQSEYESRSLYAQSELAVSAAASLAHHLIVGQKQQMALLATGEDPASLPLRHGPDLPLRHGPGALVEVLELLARVEAAPGPDFVQAVTAAAQQMPWGTLLCLITPRETAAVADLCRRLVRSGQQVLLFVLDGETCRRPHYQVWALQEAPGGEVALA